LNQYGFEENRVILAMALQGGRRGFLGPIFCSGYDHTAAMLAASRYVLLLMFRSFFSFGA